MSFRKGTRRTRGSHHRARRDPGRPPQPELNTASRIDRRLRPATHGRGPIGPRPHMRRTASRTDCRQADRRAAILHADSARREPATAAAAAADARHQRRHQRSPRRPSQPALAERAERRRHDERAEAPRSSVRACTTRESASSSSQIGDSILNITLVIRPADYGLKNALLKDCGCVLGRLPYATPRLARGSRSRFGVRDSGRWDATEPGSNRREDVDRSDGSYGKAVVATVSGRTLRRPVVGFELRRGNDNLERLVARIPLELDPVQVQRQEAAEAGSGAAAQQPRTGSRSPGSVAPPRGGPARARASSARRIARFQHRRHAARRPTTPGRGVRPGS